MAHYRGWVGGGGAGRGWEAEGRLNPPLGLFGLATVQLKGNLTYATYWLKVHSFINPYWYVRKGKSAKINF